MNYNKSQQQAIRHKDGPMLVLAGPGSGKTAVITQRTKQLIEYENIDPSNILVITFTRAAAQEMKQRFLAATGEERTKVTFGTFHAIFFMVLKLAYHLIPEILYRRSSDISLCGRFCLIIIWNIGMKGNLSGMF